MARPVHLILFAKAPLPGQAKTRLIPALGPTGTARLARWLLCHSLQQAEAAHQAGFVQSLELCCSPALADWPWAPELTLWQHSHQVAGDLGARMAAPCLKALGHSAVLLMGTDCPALTPQRIGAAARALAEQDAVMIPATDGGYVLLGLNTWLPHVFTDMPWSTNQVAAITQERLAAAGYSCQVLPPLADVDEPADLAAVPQAAFGLSEPSLVCWERPE